MLRDNLKAMEWITSKVYELESEERYLELGQDFITVVINRFNVDFEVALDAVYMATVVF